MQTAPWGVSGSSSYPRSGGHPNQAARRGRNQERDVSGKWLPATFGFLSAGFRRLDRSDRRPHLALKMFLLLYVSCLALTRWYYMRKSFLTDLAPSLAAARV
jgi:hypothetical protein